MKDYIPHYRLNQPFCLCMHNSFMSLSGGHLNGVLVKSPGYIYYRRHWYTASCVGEFNLIWRCNHPSDHRIWYYIINPAEWFTTSIMRMTEDSQCHVYVCAMYISYEQSPPRCSWKKYLKWSQNILEIPSNYQLILCSIESMVISTYKHPKIKFVLQWIHH